MKHKLLEALRKSGDRKLEGLWKQAMVSLKNPNLQNKLHSKPVMKG